jgi:hypothetical protein
MGAPKIIAISNRDASDAQMPPSEVRYVLCGGNHPANYKYLRSTRSYERKHTTPFENIHSCTDQTSPIHPTRSNIFSNNQTKLLRFHKYRARSTHNPVVSKPAITGIKKYDEKPF